MMPRPRVFLYDNDVTPYRLALYDELARHWDLHVVFSRYRGKGRLWRVELQRHRFRFDVLKSIALGPFNVNPELPLKALGEYDAYIVTVGGLQYTWGMVMSLVCAKLRGRPTILWSEYFRPPHRVPTDFPVVHTCKRILEEFLTRRFLHRVADVFVTHGQRPRELMIRDGVEPDRIFPTVSAVPWPTWKDTDICADLVRVFEGRVVVLTTAYLRKRKGVDVLIKAFRELVSDSLSLVIMGDGRERRRLEKLAAGDERIRFVGYCEGRVKHTYYSVADVFVLPAYHDPWGLVINEAMHYGLPIVTTESVGAVGYLVHAGVNGFVVRPGDQIHLRDAIGLLCSQAELRRRMGERSRDIIARNGIRAAARTFLVALRRAVSFKAVNRETITPRCL